MIAIRQQERLARLHLLDRSAEIGALLLQFRNIRPDVAIECAPFFRAGFPDRAIEKDRNVCQPLFGFGEGRFVVVEIVAQDGAANGLQFRGDLNGPNGVVRLDRHRSNGILDRLQLPNPEAGEHGAKQDQRAKATIETAANSEIEQRHGQHP